MLERQSLVHRLCLVEARLAHLARKCGVQTAAQLDEKVQSGQVHEAEAFGDYFEFDHLEVERSALRDALQELDRACRGR
jgi:hypothetical protein